MSDIGELERGANHARDNLLRTLDEVNRKAAATAQEFFLSDQPIRRYPIASVCGAMALGFAAGGWRTPAVLFGILAVANAFTAEPEDEQ